MVAGDGLRQPFFVLSFPREIPAAAGQYALKYALVSSRFFTQYPRFKWNARVCHP